MKFAHSALCASVPNDWSSDIQLHQWTCQGKASQRWRWEFFTIDGIPGNVWGILHNELTGRCMAVQNRWQSNESSQQFSFQTNSQLPNNYYWVVARQRREADPVPETVRAERVHHVDADLEARQERR